MNSDDTNNGRLKARIYDVIFGYESQAGKLFDLVLIFMILASVTAVMVDSVAPYHDQYGAILFRLEWFFTIAFTIEYALRIYSSPHPRGYIFSFYGLIDLLSILPTYLAFLFPSSIYLIVVRILRVLRIFRILKLFRYIGEARLCVWPSVVMVAKQTTMMRASITAYSTAVGPSSEAKKCLIF